MHTLSTYYLLHKTYWCNTITITVIERYHFVMDHVYLSLSINMTCHQPVDKTNWPTDRHCKNKASGWHCHFRNRQTISLSLSLSCKKRVGSIDINNERNGPFLFILYILFRLSNFQSCRPWPVTLGVVHRHLLRRCKIRFHHDLFVWYLHERRGKGGSAQ